MAAFPIPADDPFVHSYLNLSTTATFPQRQHPRKRFSDIFVDLDPQYVFAHLQQLMTWRDREKEAQKPEPSFCST